MKLFQPLIALLFSILILSCHKDNILVLANDEHLIFGQFYGECAGNGCVKTYKLTANTLFEDTNQDYSGVNFEFESMGSQAFQTVKDLPDYFPNQLLSEENTSIGCPDCYDQGGIFIQLSKNGDIKSWRIDNDKKNIPSYLHTFVDKVHEKIDLLNP